MRPGARLLLRLLVPWLALAGCEDEPKPVDLSSTIACSVDGDCPANLPTCDPAAKICTGCFVEMNTCQKGFKCDPATSRCVPKLPGDPECTRNADCPPVGEVSQRGTCLLEQHICVECMIDDDCGPPRPVCDNGSNRSIPDLGHTPTYACIDGCELCGGPLPICDRAGMRCLPAQDGGVDAGQ